MALFPPIDLLKSPLSLLVATFEVSFELVSPFSERFAEGAHANISADLPDDRADH